jgi:hypothetical protein
MMVHVYNPSYSGSRSRRTAVWAKVQDPIKNKLKQDWGHGSSGIELA